MQNRIPITDYERAYPDQEMAEGLLAKQLPGERIMYTEAVKAFVEGRVDVDKSKVTILEEAA